MSSTRPIKLTAQEQVVARARLIALELGSRLILDPSSPSLHEDLAKYIAGEGKAAMEAMAELGAQTAEEVEARVRELTTALRPSSPTPPWLARSTGPAGWGEEELQERAEPAEEFEDEFDEDQEDAEVEDEPAAQQPAGEKAAPVAADDANAWLNAYDELALLANAETGQS